MMKHLRRFLAVLCLIMTLTLSANANGGHMCCPALAPPPPPTPTTVTIKHDSETEPTSPQNDSENMLNWTINKAAEAFQFFITII